MLLRWTASFHATLNVPAGVSSPARPCIVGTGPYSTTPSFNSHARFLERLTHARTPAAQGGWGGRTRWGSGNGSGDEEDVTTGAGGGTTTTGAGAVEHAVSRANAAVQNRATRMRKTFPLVRQHYSRARGKVGCIRTSGL